MNKEDRKTYISNYNNERQTRIRLDWIKEHGGKCVKCGSTKALEVDHIDATTKEKEIGPIWGYSKEKREQELVKCQILCWSCHRDKSNIERGFKKHGTAHAYKRLGCRCVECTEAHRLANKKWYQDKRERNVQLRNG